MKKRLVKIIRLFGETVLPLVFWVSIIFGFDTPDVAILTILSAILHEIGHLLPTLVMKSRIKSVEAHISGFRIKQGGEGYWSDIIELVGGPLANALVFLLTLPFSGALGGYIGLVGSVNLVTALSSLIPIEGYDGYGIIKKLLELTGVTALIKPLFYLSFILTTAVTFLALYLLLKFGEGYWIFGVFFTILLSKIWRLTKEDILRE